MTQPASKTCPRCQHPALPDAEACSLCGQPFPPVESGLTRSSFGMDMPTSAQPQAEQAEPPGLPNSYTTPPTAYPGQTLYAPPQVGQPLQPPTQTQYPQGYQQSYPQPPYGAYGQQPYPVVYTEQKSKVAAALLAFFLGGLGVHGFYLGNTTMGVTLLIIWLVSWPLLLLFGLGLLGMAAVGIICFVQTVLYLVSSDQDFHQKYVVEKRWF